MNYQEARAFLKDKESLGSVYGLETMGILLEKLNNPQKFYKIIHVAGTNGKGSTISFVSTALKTAGYRVGRYHSPAVFGYEEKIQTDNDWIGKEAVARLLTRIKAIACEMVMEGHSHPTVFEMETAMAFLYFKEENCQIVCVETGLGGRQDATNVIDSPLVTAFTSVSMDHMRVLGDTLEKIAREKSGIIKEKTTVVTTLQNPEVEKVLRCEAEAKGAEFLIADYKKAQILENSLSGIVFSYKDFGKIKIKLLGMHQVENAVLALEILMTMQKMEYHISQNDIIKGFLATEWKGRFSKVMENPILVLDGAHNEKAAYCLLDGIKFYFTNRKICYIMGVLKDKEYEKITEITAPQADFIVTLSTKGERGLGGEILKKEAEKYCDKVIVAKDCREALEFAKKEAGEDGVILAFGSLSFLEEMEAVLDK